MKTTQYLICLWTIFALGCSHPSIDQDSVVDEDAQSVPELNIPRLLEFRHQFEDRVVTVAAYYVSHFEGSWIQHINDHNYSGTGNSIQVPYYGEHPVKILNGQIYDSTHSVNWKNGQAVFITGIFRLGELTTHQGIKLKNVALIQTQYLEAVSDKDPRWRRAYKDRIGEQSESWTTRSLAENSR